MEFKVKATTHLAFLPLAALAQLCPTPAGPYSKVHLAYPELVDHGRVGPFNETHFRRFMISRLTPIPDDQCARTCKVPYMSAEISKIEDDIFKMFFGDIGWPGQVLDKLELETCCEVKESHLRREACFPTVLFGTGYNTTRLFYSGLAQQIASLGYDVIVMDHPYETDVVQFPNGDIIFGGRIDANPNNTAQTQLALDIRTQDASFILDTLNISRAAYIGHSLGGAAAATVMPNEPRVLGGVNLDGSLWDRAIKAGAQRPFLTVGSDGHNSSVDASWSDFWDAMDQKYPDVWYRELTVEDAIHGSCWDLPIIGDITGLRETPSLLPIFGVVTGGRIMEVLRAYLDAFVKFTLLHQNEGILAGESPEIPDVHFLRESQRIM